MKYKVINYTTSATLEEGLNAMSSTGWSVDKITTKVLWKTAQQFVVIFSRPEEKTMILEEGED